MSSSIEITPELMAGFLDEAPEYLEMLDTGLMEFESVAAEGVITMASPDNEERMNTMFRAAHSLKGLAAAFGFDKIKELTHLMETLFDQIRMGKRDLTADSFETLFRVFDRLKDLVRELSDESAGPIEIEDLLEALNDILNSARDGGVDKTTASADPQASEVQPADEVMPEGPVACLGIEENEILGDPEMAALFLETTSEAIDDLNQGLLGLEDNPTDSDRLNTVFRNAHNIKGASGAAGLAGMNRLTHELETIFDCVRNGNLNLSVELMNAVFQCVDRLRAVIDALRKGRLEDVGPTEFCAHFDEWITKPESKANSLVVAVPGEAPGQVQSGEESPATDQAAPSLEPVTAADDDRLVVTVCFPEDFAEAPIQAYLIYNKLLDLGTDVTSDPDIDSLGGDSAVTKIVYMLQCDADSSEVERIIRGYGPSSVEIRDPQASIDSSESANMETCSNSESTPIESDKVNEQVAASPGASGVEAVAAPQIPEASTAEPAAVAGGVTKTATHAGSGAAESAAKKVSKPAQTIKTGETLRVDLERLDQLMNLGGELVINRARFVQIHSQFREVLDGKNLGYLVEEIGGLLNRLSEQFAPSDGSELFGRNGEEVRSHLSHLRQNFNPVRSLVEQVHALRPSMVEFEQALHGLTRVSEGIQKGIMGTRMVSVGPLFSRFKRVVRDFSKASGKQINLVLRGENTELDKRMIDELGDPLTHMVRNSVDHGIEMPDVRRTLGKDAAGTLMLEACHRGNSICIEITDDGAGINLERVKAKILERELATPAQVEKMSEREMTQYIFKPGFSTAEVVTEVSGRGMGMDIVLNKLEKINGTIEVDSTTGQGSKITIKLPLTLAILTSMVARIGRGIYAIPLESVGEIITVRHEEIQYIQRRQVVCVRDRVVPIYWFEDIFSSQSSAVQTVSRDATELTLMIVGVDDEQIGLVVDELLGQEDVVIKSIAENFRNVNGFAGASIRGDGTVSLIMDISSLLEMAGKMNGPVEPSELATVEA